MKIFILTATSRQYDLWDISVHPNVDHLVNRLKDIINNPEEFFPEDDRMMFPEFKTKYYRGNEVLVADFNDEDGELTMAFEVTCFEVDEKTSTYVNYSVENIRRKIADFLLNPNLNKDIATRDKIIFGKYEPEKYSGGIRHFKRLKLDTLKELVAQNFISLRERQNYSPTVKQILTFMNKYPDYTAHGYAVSDSRDDYRITLEGVEKNHSAQNEQEYDDFRLLFREADIINTSDEMYCWFD